MYKTKKNNRKMILISILIISILIISNISGCIGQQKNTIKVSGAFALYPMMNIWSEKYRETHQDIKIEVSAGGAGKGMADAIAGIVNIGMVSREISQEEIDQGVFWVSVAKDAVVATLNSKNPIINEIIEKGLTKQQLLDIFITRKITKWSEIYGTTNIASEKDKIKVYTRSDSCGAAETWAQYLGDYTQDDLTNSADSAINGDPNLAAAVQGDIQSIGYNNINFIYDSLTKLPFSGLIPLPLDINENGVLDENEKFYSTRNEIVNAIANDLYPSPPARALHLVTKTSFSGVTKDFINWILTEGQQYVSESGYIELSNETISLQIGYLETGERPEIT